MHTMHHSPSLELGRSPNHVCRSRISLERGLTTTSFRNDVLEEAHLLDVMDGITQETREDMDVAFQDEPDELDGITQEMMEDVDVVLQGELSPEDWELIKGALDE